jgi:hypothetical protein
MSVSFNYEHINPNDFAKCDTLLENHMQCSKKPTRVIYFIPGQYRTRVVKCEGHFQLELQKARENYTKDPLGYKEPRDLEQSIDTTKKD